MLRTRAFVRPSRDEIQVIVTKTVYRPLAMQTCYPPCFQLSCTETAPYEKRLRGGREDAVRAVKHI